MKYILDINTNEDLLSVIRKCNSNFKAIAGQLETQGKQDQRARESAASETAVEITNATEEWNQNLGDAVGDLVQQIQGEASLRQGKDTSLENAIETIDNKFSSYTPTTDLAEVAISGDYDDLNNKPPLATDQVGSAYVTFNPVSDPNTLYGGTWFLAGTLTIGVETLYAWKRSA